MNNENKKNARSVFNAIDIAILLLILICAVGIYVRYERETSINSGDGETYTVDFVCEKVRYTTVDYTPPAPCSAFLPKVTGAPPVSEVPTYRHSG